MSLLFLQQWFSEQVLKAIGWTLIHSLWQGLLAALITGIIIISTRRSKASLRYNLFGAVMGLFIIASVTTFLWQLNNATVTKSTVAGRSLVSTTDVIGITISQTSTENKTATIDKFIGYFDRNADLFVLIWAIFFFVHCIKLGTGLAGVHRMRSYKIFEAPAGWSSRLKQLCRIVGVKETIQLLESGLVKVPVAIGMFKPVILVPIGLISHLPPEQVETILLHELAHIRRKDYLVNILQRFAEAIFFFNPALLWISSLIRQEREACCDDIVIANTTHKGNYLEALVAFQEYSLPEPGYAMAIGSKRNFLLNRVKRMITHENQKLNGMEKVFLAMGLIAVTAFTFIPKDPPVKKAMVPASQSTVNTEQKVTTDGAIVAATTAVAKKEYKKTDNKMRVGVIPTDTVPSKKEKTVNEELHFPSISSTINDDGTTKTESILATDQDGKKYSFTKLNGKITSLTVDGKNIPESDYGRYSSLVEQIERSVEERQVMRLHNLAAKKMTLENNQSMKNQLFQKKLIDSRLKESQQLQKKILIEQQMHLKQNLQMNQQEKKMMEKKSREVMKQLRLLKQKQMVPMVDGREVSVIGMTAPVKTSAPVTVTLSSVKLVPVQLQTKPIEVTQKIVSPITVKLKPSVLLKVTAPCLNSIKPECKSVPSTTPTEVKPVPVTPVKTIAQPVKSRVVT